MTRVSRGLLVLLAMAVLWPADASAQLGRRRAPAYARVDVERLVERLEKRSDQFRETFDRALDRSRLDGSDAEDRMNEEVKDLENALDDLRSDFDRNDRIQETRRQVERVMRHAERVNALVRRLRLSAQVDREWAAIRADLNALAAACNVRPLR